MRSAIESAFVSPRPSTRRKQGESVAEAVLISFSRVAVGFPQFNTDERGNFEVRTDHDGWLAPFDLAERVKRNVGLWRRRRR